MRRSVIAEFVGSCVLLLVIVGSGIVVQELTIDPALALFTHAVAVGASLAVLITLLWPISGAHLNPAVTLAAWRQRAMTGRAAGAYVTAQVTGAVAGVILSHVTFERALVSVSGTVRDGIGRSLAEVISAFVLVLLIGGLIRTNRQALIPWVAGLWVATAIFATSSTGFANPAVTLARAFTDSYSGIAPSNILAFIGAQLFGALLARPFIVALFPTGSAHLASGDQEETSV